MTGREFMLAFRGYHTPSFRIVQRRNRWFALSSALIALALIGLFVSGLNFSIDFKGGLAVFARAALLLAERKVPLDRDVILHASAGEGDSASILVGRVRSIK